MRGIIFLAILSLTSCSPSNKEPDDNLNTTSNFQKTSDTLEIINETDNIISNKSPPPPAQIGGAYMDKDGTIHLHLSFEDNNGIGEGYFTYKKTDKDYQYILNHISPIRPGQGKSVYAFPPEAKAR